MAQTRRAEAPMPSGAPGTVVDEASRGYVWNNELLRPARAQVTQ